MADVSSNEMPRRGYPCAECPWRRDTEPGQFPARRLRPTDIADGAVVDTEDHGHYVVHVRYTPEHEATFTADSAYLCAETTLHP